MDDLTGRAAHFEFGANWAEFSAFIDESRIARAEADLARLLPGGLAGQRVIDIGCGSGLSALAALRLGAARIDAYDLDERSVSTATALLTKLAPGGSSWSVSTASVFDLHPDRTGHYDVVYSWGVLHHTGDMARAIRTAAALVRPGGRLAIAIYAKTPLCGWWAREKRWYARAPRALQMIARGAFTSAWCASQAAHSRNPARLIREYGQSRGMRFQNDIHDWLGGYPYESATPEEVAALVGAGFSREREFVKQSRTGLFGSGCSEFVFRRAATA